MARRAWNLVMVTGALVAGCADPYEQDRDRSGTSHREEAPRGDERPPRAPARDTAPAVATDAADTPRAAIQGFCSQWANWTWRTIERQQRRLASMATGPLRSQLAAEAGLRAQDGALRRDRLGARGRVVAIDIKRGAETREAICVAWEEPLAQGHVDIEGGRHRMYLATVAKTDTGWTVRRWQPQL
jgi:hypothetical protein